MGQNSQLHITLTTCELDKLRKEAEELEISVAELIRRKLSAKPTEEEILELRRLKQFLKKGESK